MLSRSGAGAYVIGDPLWVAGNLIPRNIPDGD